MSDFLGTLLAPDYIPPVKPTIHHPVETPPKRTIVKTVERKRKCDVLIPGTKAAAPTPAKKGCFQFSIGQSSLYCFFSFSLF